MVLSAEARSVQRLSTQTQPLCRSVTKGCLASFRPRTATMTEPVVRLFHPSHKAVRSAPGKECVSTIWPTELSHTGVGY